MSKKAQITIFIIIGILTITILALFLLIKNYNFQPIKTMGLYDDIKQVSEDCIKDGGERAIFNIQEYNPYVYLILNKNNIPFNQDIIYLINEDVKNSKHCIINNFNSSIEVIISPDTKINDNNLIIDTDYEIKLEEGNFKEKTSNRYNIRLGIIQKVIKEIVNTNIRDKENVCLNCLSDIAERYDLVFDISQQENLLFISIEDKNSTIYGEPYKIMIKLK